MRIWQRKNLHCQLVGLPFLRKEKTPLTGKLVTRMSKQATEKWWYTNKQEEIKGNKTKENDSEGTDTSKENSNGDENPSIVK